MRDGRPQPGLTSVELMSLFPGLTPRKVQWLDERKIIPPFHEGHKRIFDLRQAEEIGILCQLRNAGISMQFVRKVLKSFRRLRAPSSLLLVFQNGTIQPAANSFDVLARLLHSNRSAMVIDLEGIRAKARGAV